MTFPVGGRKKETNFKINNVFAHILWTFLFRYTII